MKPVFPPTIIDECPKFLVPQNTVVTKFIELLISGSLLWATKNWPSWFIASHLYPQTWLMLINLADKKKAPLWLNVKQSENPRKLNWIVKNGLSINIAPPASDNALWKDWNSEKESWTFPL